MDKFIAPVHPPDKDGEQRGLEEDPTEQIWDNMNFNKDKNSNGLKHIKYA